MQACQLLVHKDRQTRDEADSIAWKLGEEDPPAETSPSLHTMKREGDLPEIVAAKWSYRPLPSEMGAPSNVIRTFDLKPRPQYSLDRLMHATFARRWQPNRMNCTPQTD